MLSSQLQPLSNNNGSSSNDKVLLSIDIELTENESALLEIRDKDNINCKINDFCKKYALSEQLKGHLNSLVKQKIKKEIKDLEERSNSKGKKTRMNSPGRNEQASPKTSSKSKTLQELMQNLDDEEKESAHNKNQVTRKAKIEENEALKAYQVKKEEKMKENEEKGALAKIDIGKSIKASQYAIEKRDLTRDKSIEALRKEENEKESEVKKPMIRINSIKQHGTNLKSPRRIQSPPKYNESNTKDTSSSLINKSAPSKNKSNIILINKGQKRTILDESIPFQQTSPTSKPKEDNKAAIDQEFKLESANDNKDNTQLDADQLKLKEESQQPLKRIFIQTPNKRSIRPSIQSPKNQRTSYNNKTEPSIRSRSKGKVMNMINEDNSAEVIFRLKYAKYKEIFDSLDTNKDGLISSRFIGLCAIPHWQLKALTPILEDLQRTQADMDFKDFCLKIGKLLTTQLFDEDDLYIMKDHLGNNMINSPK